MEAQRLFWEKIDDDLTAHPLGHKKASKCEDFLVKNE